MAIDANPTENTLPRVLGPVAGFSVVVGSVIGSGIFLVPGDVLGQAQGDVGVALLVWTAGGVLSLLGALTYGELGALNPEAGGIYVYLREAYSPLLGFLYGWTFFLVIQTRDPKFDIDEVWKFLETLHPREVIDVPW